MKILKIIPALIILHSICCFPIYAQWQKTSLPDSLGTIYAFKMIGNKIFVSTLDVGVWVSDDHGSTWTPKNNGIRLDPYPYSNHIVAFDTMGDIIFTAGVHGIYSSTDTGNSWKSIPTLKMLYPGGIIDSTPGISSIAINREKIFITVYAKDSGLCVSADTGKSWKTTNKGLNITSAYHPRSVFHVGRNRLLVGKNGGIYLSKDNGANWAGKLGISPGSLIEHFVWKGNIIYASTWSGGVYASSDSGDTWKPMNDGLWQNSTYYVTANREAVFAGCANGIYMLSSGDTTWIDITSNSELAIVYAIGVDDTYVYAGLNSGGIWRRPLSEIITGIKDISPQKSGIKVYPNPTDNSVNIEIENINLSKQEVAFILYDSAGKKVKQIKVPQNKFKIDKGNLLPGVYLYELRQQKNILYTGKLVIQ